MRTRLSFVTIFVFIAVVSILVGVTNAFLSSKSGASMGSTLKTGKVSVALTGNRALRGIPGEQLNGLTATVTNNSNTSIVYRLKLTFDQSLINILETNDPNIFPVLLKNDIGNYVEFKHDASSPNIFYVYGRLDKGSAKKNISFALTFKGEDMQAANPSSQNGIDYMNTVFAKGMKYPGIAAEVLCTQDNKDAIDFALGKDAVDLSDLLPGGIKQ